MTDAPVLVLEEGELRRHETFGPGTVNRGAVLFDCIWDGGTFESGVMVRGLFRSGTFRGGVFWGGVWLGGDWKAGDWESGFGLDGQYHPRTVHP
ncbi:MAG: hypothetical protein ABI584_13805 [Acidobacteriota bacterium]